MGRTILRAVGLALLLCLIIAIAIIGFSFLSYQQQTSSVSFIVWLKQQASQQDHTSYLWGIIILIILSGVILKEKPSKVNSSPIQDPPTPPSTYPDASPEPTLPQPASASVTVGPPPPPPKLNQRVQQLKQALFEHYSEPSLLLDQKLNVVEANQLAQQLLSKQKSSKLKLKLAAYLQANSDSPVCLSELTAHDETRISRHLSINGEASVCLNFQRLLLDGGDLWLLQLMPPVETPVVEHSPSPITLQSQQALEQQLRRAQTCLSSSCLASLNEDKKYSKEQVRRQLLEQSLQLTMLSSEVIQLLATSKADKTTFNLLTLLEQQIQRFAPYAALHQNNLHLFVDGSIYTEYKGDELACSQIFAQLLWAVLANCAGKTLELSLSNSEEPLLSLNKWPGTVSLAPLTRQLQRSGFDYSISNDTVEIHLSIQPENSRQTLSQQNQNTCSLVICCQQAIDQTRLIKQCRSLSLTAHSMQDAEQLLTASSEHIIILGDQKTSHLKHLELQLSRPSRSIQIVKLSSVYPSQLLAFSQHAAEPEIALEQTLLQQLLPMTDPHCSPSIALSLLVISDDETDLDVVKQYSKDTASSVETHTKLAPALLACTSKSFDLVLANGSLLNEQQNAVENIGLLRKKLPKETGLLLIGDHRFVSPLAKNIACLSKPINHASLARSIDSWLNQQLNMDDKISPAQQLEASQQRLLSQGAQSLTSSDDELNLAALIGSECSHSLGQLCQRESQQLLQQVKLNLDAKQWSEALSYASALHACVEKFSDKHALFSVHQLCLQLEQFEFSGAQHCLLQLKQLLKDSLAEKPA